MNRRSARPAAVRVVVLLCAALIASTGADAPGVSAAGGAATPTRADVDAAAAFRAKLGLRSDRAFVAATFGKAGYSAAMWGVPLDKAESADLAGRAKLQKDLGGALRAWARDPTSAGAYIDHEAKGAPVFLTTAAPTKVKAAVAREMPAGANARFVRVAHSMAELVALQDRINADLRDGSLAALGVTSTAIDARANAVRIGVAVDSEAVGAALRARYGDAVAVRLEAPAQGGDACTARTDCSPARSGIEIRSSYNGNNCTIGFLVRVAGSPDPRVLTAGHCVGKSGGAGTSRTWTNDGSQVGWAEFSYWTDGADADVALLNPTTAAVSGSRNLLYRSSAGDITSITGWRANAEQIQGSMVCRSAAVSGYHCGTIELTNRTKDVDGESIDHQWVVDFDACPGDSGAPYFAGSTAYGIHSDSTVGCEPSTNEAWYSPIGWVLDTLAARGHPVSLCVTASCGSNVNVWTQRGSLPQSSWGARLIDLADGRVLQLGGTTGDLLVVGDGGSTARVPQLFDPSTGQWLATANPPWLPASCDGQFAVRLDDGRVLVGGGRHVGSGTADACDGAYIYSPGSGSTGSWTTAAAPPTRLEGAGAALLQDGRAFVTGGSGASGGTSVAMAYDPGDNVWTTLTPAASGALDALVLGLRDGRVLVSGGYTIADAAGPGYVDVSATRIYSPSTDSWTTTTAVGARGAAGVVLANGRVVVAGGQRLTWDGSQHSSFLKTVSQLEPSTGSWTSLASLPTGRTGFTLAELGNGLVLAAGGRIAGGTFAGTPSGSAEAYDPASKAWYPAPSLRVAHGGQGSAVLGDGSVLVAGGATTASETYVAGDVLPAGSTAPSSALRSAVTMGATTVPLRLSWSGSDTGGSGVGTYDVARSADGGAYSTIASQVTRTTWDTTVANGHTYRFRVRARDWAGNVGGWATAATIRSTVTQESSGSIHYTGSWTSAGSSSYSAGGARYGNTSGESASLTFTGRAIAFVSARGPNRGSARIYVDGSLVSTVNLNAASLSYRYVAFQRSWSSTGKHTIRVVTVGSSGHPRVDLDAFEVISNP